jgi:hypothetical protein
MNFAKLNGINVVIDLTVVNDNAILDPQGVPQPSIGVAFLQNITGYANWAYYDGISDGQRAEIGGSYDPNTNTFSPAPPNF